ncbi:GDSL-like Lipase/Acylhydrolase superfamily protein [Perilla frutescens var. hirtella]|uniref:GDSL-like Lipase/Acylhydrolase superfamily protein n=1 Tax=Perilla frutescens var. hirtella TaxID=608512 RepID=A0AAD4J8G6_PERFH|nr:GDSL-like Lipase/Acylhydrolase superfamily protein [Perilla frutescens var. hirtella]
MSVIVTRVVVLVVATTVLWLNNETQVAEASDGTGDDEVIRINKHTIRCILVLGDSSVDPGNNNRLPTTTKSNFIPYGIDFFHGRPSGRFCNGRLATDYLAEAFGYTDSVRAFLDPAITKKDLLHGVSFASAGSGYDELTANLSSVIPMWKQLEYLRHYKIHLRNLVGTQEAEEIIRNNTLFVVSAGTNDFLLNYYSDSTRSKQYSIEQYMNYLISRMRTVIKTMRSLGARKVVVVGVPPLGCMPIVRTLRNVEKCDIESNKLAFRFSSKIRRESKMLGRWTLFLDINTIILNAIQNPKRYGFVETLKGCCGSGTYEYGEMCKGMSICSDRTKYVFWDAVHPSQNMYKIIADSALELLLKHTF